MLKIKRAYEPVSPHDGFRVLIDRLWPRGISKKNLPLNAWYKELAPSTELRKEFGHDSTHWRSFQKKYKIELQSAAAQEIIMALAKKAKKRSVTLIYGARDQEHNDAVVLKNVIDKEIDP